jgi:hypothetical protein
MIWYPFLGWGIFWISLVASIILFAIYKKMYPIFYLISIALYVFTCGFAINVFEFGKLQILTTLLFSAILFMGLGYYFSKIFLRTTEENNFN